MIEPNLKIIRSEKPETKQPEKLELKAMTNEDADRYIEHLAKSKGAGLSGIEASTEKFLRETAAEIGANMKRIQELNVEARKLNDENQKKGGQMDAYAKILILAEDTRRAEQKNKEKENDGQGKN